MKRKIVAGAAALILTVIFVISGYHIYLILGDRQAAEDVYEDLSRFIQLPEAMENTAKSGLGENGTGGDGNSETESRNGKTVFPKVDFEALREINSQVAGWIYCEGNTINFPIAQGDDNEYYLKHMFNGEQNPDGCIFLDNENKRDFSDTHSIIYGHHMNSGAMFAPLLEYKSQEYYKEHPRMLLMTPEENYVVELFAGYVADVEDDAWQIGFVSTEDYEAWIYNSISRSCFASDIIPQATDRILTLSTCSYEFDNARFVLLGILKTE